MTVTRPSSHRRAVLLGALVAGVTLAAYVPSVAFGFVSLDDRTYVTSNPYVLAGFSSAGFRWAWTASYAANWHPLTWLSLMLDAEIGGGAPWSFHLTNVLLHTANSVLLFASLGRMTRRLARSAFVAALFGIHPLHVESVAWIAERKDVLSTFFWFLLLLAYVRYSAAPSRARMGWVAACLAASLLAKPMMVTAPLVLLLLDYWPLGRATGDAAWARLIREKWLLAGLSAAACVIALVAQTKGGAVRDGVQFPFVVRAANASIAYGAYLVHTVWPAGLAVFYPHPGRAASVGAALASAAVLIAISAVALAALRVRPYVIVGWGWYVVTLIPVIGLVQVGLQGSADRYTYVPLVGVFILVTWGLADLGRSAFGAGSRAGATVSALSATLVVAVLALTTRSQTELWRSETALYEHALRVTRNNDFTQAALGSALAVRGDLDAARAHLDEALRLNPKNVEARHDRAVLHLREGQPDPAVDLLRSVLADSPSFDEARAELASALLAQGDVVGADRESTTVIDHAPWIASAQAARGAVRLAERRLPEAEAAFREAVRLDPDAAEYETGLGNACAGRGKTEDAVAAYRVAVRLRPDSFQAHLPLGALLFQSGRTKEGLAHLEEAVRLDSTSVNARLNLGVALFKLGRAPDALVQFRWILASDPKNERAAAYLRLAEAPPRTNP